MRILGVDPGLRVTGYGVISTGDGSSKNGEIELIEAGIIRTEAKAGIAGRLKTIHDSLAELILELEPEILVIEKLFAHYKHPATAILMGHARGVICLLSGTMKVPLTSIASTHVKKAVTGSGHASKLQIQRMVQNALKLKSVPEPPDVADALALAISYAVNVKKRASIK